MREPEICALLYKKVCSFWRKLHHWQKLYTAAGNDRSDKYHLCLSTSQTVRVYLITDDVGCIEVGELFVRRRLHWSKKPSSNTQSHLCVLQKPRYMKILLRKSQPKNIHIKHMNSVETYSSSLQLHEWTTLSPFIPRGNVSIAELMVKYATILKTSLDDQ